LFVLYGSRNKQVSPHSTNRRDLIIETECLLWGTSWIFKSDSGSNPSSKV